MSKYLPNGEVGLAEIVKKYGFHSIQHDCKIYPGKTGPSDKIERFIPEHLSDLIPYYSHPIFYLRMSNLSATSKNKNHPLEIWISSKSYAELAREEGHPIEEFEKIESDITIAIAEQRIKEETEVAAKSANNN